MFSEGEEAENAKSNGEQGKGSLQVPDHNKFS